ncbi:MAG: hypothetical protein AB8B69_10575 [Chitinophagales bacterium]
MKYFKHFLILFVFLFGFGAPSCEPPCECALVEGEFFDIREVTLANWKLDNISGGVSANLLEEGESVNSDAYQLWANFEVDYVGLQLPPENNFSFSLIPSAYACSCIENGEQGGKETLQDLQIITKNDFDADHPANSSLNDLMVINFGQDEENLVDYLERAVREPFMFPSFFLTLKQGPSVPSNFEVTVAMTLDNGEFYEVDSEVVVMD